MAWSDGIEGVTLEIAGHDGPPLRVQAGPGTGKTFALQKRVTRLLETGVPPKRILVVTFTRVAAHDLRESLSALGVDGCNDVEATTLHSLCFKVLTREDVFPILNRVPRPLISVYRLGWRQYEFDPLLADLDDPAFGNKRRRTERIQAFEAAWARRQRDDDTFAVEETDRAFEAALTSWLEFHQAILIGELVPITLLHLQHNPLDRTLNDYTHVIVDEYQDLNKSEQLLVDVIAARSHLAIVGDSDQSIYSFKFAHPDGMADFSERHPGVKDKTLNECWRCPTTVVAAANNIILHNQNRLVDALLEPRIANSPGRITHVQWRSVDDEVHGIAAYVNHLLSLQDAAGQRVYEAADILILCPSRDIAYMLRGRLLDSHVSAHSFYHEEALEQDDARIAFSTLSYFIARSLGQEDLVSLRFWLGFGSDTWLAEQYRTLRGLCEVEGKSPRQLLDEVIHENRTIPGIHRLVARYKALETRLHELYAVDAQAALNLLFDDQFEWAKPFRELIDTIREAQPEATIKDVFEGLRDYITQPELPSHPEYVRIMSLHKSKGLTSKVVVVCSAVEGSIPRLRPGLTPVENAAHIEEQRRLFYVAVTRPKEVLLVSHYRRIPEVLRFRAGARLNNNRQTYPSQFIADANGVIPPARSGATWMANSFA
jgi:DNA helicase II / ATP-dependent DNA helicase PcrA